MFRSLIFVPSNSEKYINKAKTLTYQARNVYARINSFDSGMTSDDLKAVVQKGIDGIILPKVGNDEEVSEVDRILLTLEQEKGFQEKSIKIAASIESANGVVNSYSIAKASDRVNMLVFGIFDFLYDMGLDYVQDGIEYSFARAKIPIDARAAGIGAIDAIWQKVDDIEGLVRDAGTAKRLGYQGKCVIHPKQLEPITSVFIPSNNEIEWARKVVQALQETVENGKGIGAVTVDGKMVDAAHYRQARFVLDSLNTK